MRGTIGYAAPGVIYFFLISIFSYFIFNHGNYNYNLKHTVSVHTFPLVKLEGFDKHLFSI